MQGGGGGDDKEGSGVRGEQHGDGGGQLGTGGQQPGGGLGQPGAGALQQPCPSGKLFQSYNISLNTIPIFTVVSKVLPIPSLPCWLLPRRQHHSMKAFALVTKTFLLRDLCPENSLPCRCCFVAKPIFLSNVNNFGFWNDLINFLRYFVQFVTRAILFGGTTTMTAAHLNDIV